MKKLNHFRGKIVALKSNPEFVNIFSNTGWLMGERLFRLLIGLLVGVLVTRYLGPERYGIYSYALSFSVLFTALASFGIDSIVIREMVKDKDRQNQLMGTAFALKLFGGALSLLISLIVLVFVDIDFTTKVFIWIIVSSTIVTSFNVIDSFFQARVESRFIVKTNTITLILSSCIKIALILMEAPLLGFVLILLFDSVSRALGYLYFYKKHKYSLFQWKFEMALAKSLLKESWPLILSGLAISVAMRIDQIMLKTYVTDGNLGFYAVGVRLAELFSFLPMIIGQSVYPKIIKINFKTGKKKISQLIGYVFYLLCAMALVVTLLANFGINLLYGVEFDPSTQVLQILIWTIPVTYLGIITNQLLMVESHQKIIFVKQLMLALLNICLNLYLIPKYGIVGAAVATLMADITINLFFDIVFNKSRWIFYLKMRALFLIHNQK